MKKLFYIFFILFTANVFAQYIIVTPSSNANSLVNNNLIQSACVTATNISSSTGTNFSSNNGVGSFTNTNLIAFPMASGVILTTGNVSNAPGPNNTILSDGSTAWPGDADLATQFGNPTSFYNNASILEFDFTPVNSQFSFDYIFASEEYGSSQCQPFPDAFAFLLTNTVTNVTTNLAVLPGTTTPVSVETIRDNAYLNLCPSVNPSFFGNFYGGSNFAFSPTNFNGQTVLLNASAVLIPGVLYHIKLVIADRGDTLNDSAVFISGSSFNAGQDVLGPDKTVANNGAPCFGSSYTITSGLNPTDYTFTWTNSAGTVFGNGTDLIVNSADNYTLTYLKNGSICPAKVNSIIIEFKPEIKTVQPIDIYKCGNGLSTYSFNIALNTPILLAGSTLPLIPALPTATTQISYFANAALTIPITSPYTAASNTTVYVKITNTATNCFISKPFQLLVTTALAPPITLPVVSLCENSPGSSQSTLVLSGFDGLALNGNSPLIYNVSYYSSQINANAGTPKLSASYLASNNETIYVRIENKTDTTGCPNFTSFIVNVLPKPNITDTPSNIIICPNDFYTLPPLAAGETYWTQTNGPSGTGILLPVGFQILNPALSSPPEPNPVRIYVYLNNGTCKDETSFTVTFLDLNLITPPDANHCGSFVVPSSDYAAFYSAPHTAANPNPPLLPAGTVIQPSLTPVTIYLYYEVKDRPIQCPREIPFTLNITANPTISGFGNVFKCSSETYTLPNLPNATDFVTPATATVNYYSDAAHTNLIPAGTVITSSQTVFILAESGPKPCLADRLFTVSIGLDKPLPQNRCVAYTLPGLSFGKYYKLPGGTSAAGQVAYPSGTVITESQVVWLYEVSSSGCFEEWPITIIIKLPKINPVAAVSVCATDNYILPPLQIVPPNNSVNPPQNYQPLFYNSAANGSGTNFSPGDTITSSQTIYVVASDGLPNGCRDSKPIVITVNPQLVYNASLIIPSCSKIKLSPQTGFTYYYDIDKTLLIPTNQEFSADAVVYAHVNAIAPCAAFYRAITIVIDLTVAIQYPDVNVCTSYTLPTINQAVGENNLYFDGPHTTTNIPTLIPPGTSITSTQTIYVYNKKLIRSGTFCSDEKSFTVTINPNPVLPNFPNIISCGEYTLPALTLGSYFSQTGGGGTQYVAGDKIKTSQTVYVFAGNSAIPAANCVTDNKSFTVTIKQVDKLNDITECASYVLPALTFGDYFSGPLGTGTPKFAGNSITTNQTIYIYKKVQTNSTIPFTFCDSQTQFTVTIIPRPTAYPIPLNLRTFCDTDGENDGNFLVDLSTYSAAILNPIIPPTPPNPQIGPQFTIGFYATLADANANPPTKPIIAPTILKNVFVRVSNTLTPNCFDVQPFTIIINELPKPTNPLKAFICLNSKTGLILNPYTINSGLTSPNTFVWTDVNNVIIGTGATLPNIVVPGVYSLQVTNPQGCVSRSVTNVAFSQAAIVSYSLSENFSDNQFVTIIATGSGGDYEYQLDDNEYQNSPILENVPYGSHLVNVRDKNGCGKTPISVLVVNYPKYFTPNDDNINDYWNVIGLEKDFTSNIFIYDRFGKLLTQIKPYGIGWDGIYNGIQLPSTDYWFSVTYLVNGIDKIFKAHFTLKR